MERNNEWLQKYIRTERNHQAIWYSNTTTLVLGLGALLTNRLVNTGLGRRNIIIYLLVYCKYINHKVMFQGKCCDNNAAATWSEQNVQPKARMSEANSSSETNHNDDDDDDNDTDEYQTSL